MNVSHTEASYSYKQAFFNTPMNMALQVASYS